LFTFYITFYPYICFIDKHFNWFNLSFHFPCFSFFIITFLRYPNVTVAILCEYVNTHMEQSYLFRVQKYVKVTTVLIYSNIQTAPPHISLLKLVPLIEMPARCTGVSHPISQLRNQITCNWLCMF